MPTTEVKWMKKKERLDLLKTILLEENIEKQEDFVRILKEKGIEVTQATISRDMKELQLVKVPVAMGGYKYVLPTDLINNTPQKLEKKMKDSFISIDRQNELLLLKTVPGNAFALGALIENVNFKEVFGLIAGDDTILIICRSNEQAEILQEKFIRFI